MGPSSYETLITDPEIQAILAANQGAAREIKMAAELLADRPDAKAALKKGIPALVNKQISIFFSYKQKDEQTARAIVELLRKKSAGKLKITYQYEFGENIVGRRYRQTIREEISHANWFILLLPDPKEDWDWCLFETGHFESQQTSADRLICLHHPDTTLPSPIKDYHAVKAENEEVKKLLDMIFIKENPVPGFFPVNPDIEDEIPDLADKIVHAIKTPVTLVREIYEPWIELQVDSPGELESKEQLDDAFVLSANPKALELFSLKIKKPTWGELRANLPEPLAMGAQWLEDLFKVIQKLGKGFDYYPIQSVFQTFKGKIYRPVVCAVDRDGNEGEIKVFHITFSEDVTVVDRSAMPKNVSVLANVLHGAFRFRWEVLEKFGKGRMTEDAIHNLENALLRIKQDWESRNLGGQQEMLDLFPDREDQNRITDMFTIWEKARNKDQNGELDIAIKEKDLEKIPEILRQFLPVNQRFLEMAADRFARLVAEK